VASRLVPLNDATFDEWTANEAEVTVVCVGAKWCDNTQQLKPLLGDLGAQYARKVRFAMVDFDESPEFVKKYNITAVPTLQLFKLSACEEEIDVACQFDMKARRDAIEDAIRRVL
jgi:thioredoxin-like negative regulator of GroEL